jgi:hypothetical protein
MFTIITAPLRLEFYHLYLETITQNNQSQGSVNFPVGQTPGAAVAAH